MHFISIQFFFTIVPSTEQLIQILFSQIATTYENHERVCNRAILTEKNNDGNAMNNIIQGQILGKYKLISRLIPL